ncbi:MAG TPA: hypothetical protein VJQ54_20845 [Candidatus Sulfotelmatobacter sp.]|nr:hypothetical protein [Candidatus Sulfotelmatobacter sp.]
MFFPRLLAAVLLVACLMPLSAQEESRRLILKDGSYQLITRYEVKGDRVRYYSAEREEWEELPSALVDWTATEKYEKDRASSASAPEAIQLDKELEHENELAEAKLPQVAPGLRIPMDQGVFLLDTFQGEPQLVEVQQNVGDINQDRKGNILRSAVNPVAGVKAAIELERAHAAVQCHATIPSLYLNIEAERDQANEEKQDTQQPSDRFHILHAEVKGNKRILGDVKRQVTGKISQEQHLVKTTVTRLQNGWLKITPTEPLPPGEYVLAEMMGKEGMNLYVWDFGVNPKAPANANPWKAEIKQPKPQANPEH